MRLGLHCGREQVTAALLDRGSVRSCITVPTRGTPIGAAETLLKKLASSLEREPRSEPVTSITFEVSDILTVDTTAAIHLIRISPRPTAGGRDTFDMPMLDDDPLKPRPRITHVPGGHDARGQEIVSLDLRGLEHLELPDLTQFVVTGVGALLNPGHELRVGAALLERFPAASVEYSHQFHHISFAVRERTAFVNLSLRDSADTTATAISVSASALFPNARLLVAVNSGGCSPIQSLAISPVDSVASNWAAESVGAMHGVSVYEGTFTYETPAGNRSCELSGGLPSVVPALQSSVFGKLASPAVIVRQVDVPEPSAPRFDSVSILRAQGAAQLPRADWIMTLIQVANEAEMNQAKQTAEARLRAKLVASGMAPENVRIVESLVTATSYGNPEVIALRIRAIADEDPRRRSSGGLG